MLPTRYEPWGIVVIEALGSGLPVVTSLVAGAASAVSDGRTGRIVRDVEDAVELAEALRWALSDAPARPEEIAASVAQYRWSEVIARYEGALRAAAGRHPSVP